MGNVGGMDGGAVGCVDDMESADGLLDLDDGAFRQRHQKVVDTVTGRLPLVEGRQVRGRKRPRFVEPAVHPQTQAHLLGKYQDQG